MTDWQLYSIRITFARISFIIWITFRSLGAPQYCLLPINPLIPYNIVSKFIPLLYNIFLYHLSSLIPLSTISSLLILSIVLHISSECIVLLPTIPQLCSIHGFLESSPWLVPGLLRCSHGLVFTVERGFAYPFVLSGAV